MIDAEAMAGFTMLRCSLMLACALLVSCGGAADGDAPGAALQPPPAPRSRTSGPVPPPVLDRWFALGSGCRARWDLPGDVQVSNGARGGRHWMRVRLHGLALSASAPAAGPTATARDCAIRVAVNPPPDTRVADVYAQAAVVVERTGAADITTAATLRLGARMLGHAERHWDGGGRQLVSLSARGARSLEPQPCGGPTIIGVDATWIAHLTAAKDRARVSLEDRELKLGIELEPCGDGGDGRAMSARR